MNIVLREIKKEYYVIVNRKEIAQKAEELGYDNVIVFEGKTLDAEALSAIKDSEKAVVLAFDWTDDPESYKAIKAQLDEQGINYIEVSADDGDGGYYEVGDKDFSLEKLVKTFPEVEKIENSLVYRAFIRSTDYTNRCGNCHAYMREGFKYCEKCGTERGKGAFLPYKNDVYCVYGPPIKTKFKCASCGHIWIDGDLGSHKAYYCPQCGKKKAKCIEERYDETFAFDTIGTEEPYDVDEKPRFFDDDQVRILLSKRKAESEASGSYSENEKELFEILDSIGVKIPVNDRGFLDPRTEMQGDQIWQARKILSVKGTDLNGHGSECCKHCGSHLIAAIVYSVTGKGYVLLTDDLHVPCRNNALTIRLGDKIFYDREESRTANHPAYFCLNCGESFGKLPVPEKLDK